MERNFSRNLGFRFNRHWWKRLRHPATGRWKTDALHRTKWATPLHFAWDRMVDEPLVIEGLKLISKHHLRSTSNGVYVLIGYDTTPEEDLYRCQVIDDYGLTPYPMPYVRNSYTKRFKRFMNLHFYRNIKQLQGLGKRIDKNSFKNLLRG